MFMFLVPLNLNNCWIVNNLGSSCAFLHRSNNPSITILNFLDFFNKSVCPFLRNGHKKPPTSLCTVPLHQLEHVPHPLAIFTMLLMMGKVWMVKFTGLIWFSAKFLA